MGPVDKKFQPLSEHGETPSNLDTKCDDIVISDFVINKGENIVINQQPAIKQETAAYIAALLADLKEMADKAHLPFLVYLIDIAQKEAIAQRDGEV